MLTIGYQQDEGLCCAVVVLFDEDICSCNKLCDHESADSTLYPCGTQLIKAMRAQKHGLWYVFTVQIVR